MWERFDYLRDVLAAVREMTRLAGVRYFIAMYSRVMWADARIRLGMKATFSRDAVRASGQFDAGTEFAAQYYACLKRGDRAGMRLWSEAGAYAVISEADGKQIRIVD